MKHTLKEAYAKASNRPINVLQVGASGLMPDAWILAHAFNVLPEVVEALKKAAEVIRSEYPQHQHAEYGLLEIDAVIAKASTIELGGDE